MISIIAENVQVDDAHSISVVDARLVPVEVVDVIVRSAAKMGFLETAKSMDLDTPPDYSVSYEDLLRGN